MNKKGHKENIEKTSARTRYQEARRQHWDSVASTFSSSRLFGQLYQRQLHRYYRFLIPLHRRVLELGCAQGDLLNALEPSEGIGVDFSAGMIEGGKKKYPHLRFVQADAHELSVNEKVDAVVLSDLLNDLRDVQQVLEQIQTLCTPQTRVVLNFHNNLWKAPLALGRGLGLAAPLLQQNWLEPNDVKNLLGLAGFEVIRHSPKILFPFPIPILHALFNRFLVNLWPFNIFALTHFMVARPIRRPDPMDPEPSVSIVIAARNEAGNIERVLNEVPDMGRSTEIVFVEGHSTDNTYETIEKTIQKFPGRQCKLFRQPGKGKADAVRLGFEKAEGEILMILDADLTVPAADLTRFYEALRQGQGEFINGVRLVYPMEKHAMRFLNLVGNKFFSMAFSWLLDQPIKDTLCGTKVLRKNDYEHIVANRSYFGDFDPFGDYDLIFGAAKLNLKIVDLPIRYQDRTYGDTNIQRWRHGVLLLRMAAFAARRLKFI